jgi:hypothetical protein
MKPGRDFFVSPLTVALGLQPDIGVGVDVIVGIWVGVGVMVFVGMKVGVRVLVDVNVGVTADVASEAQLDNSRITKVAKINILFLRFICSSTL